MHKKVVKIWVNCADIVRFAVKNEKNKSEHEEDLSSTFDRALSIVYKSSMFPTISFFVSEKIEFFMFFHVKYGFLHGSR